MEELSEYVDGLPNLCGSEQTVAAAIAAGRHRRPFPDETSVCIDGIDNAFAVALHVHQPLIPAGGPDLRTAAIVGNLQWMLEHPDVGDNHNAPVFHWCYKRMGELIPQLLAEGSQSRIMLEYSGRRCYICLVRGMLRPRRGLASGRQGQLVECDRHPPGRRLLDRQLVMATPQVLYEAMAGDHDLGAAILDVGLVHEPTISHGVPARARSLGDQACEPLHPPVDGDVVNLDTALGE